MKGLGGCLLLFAAIVGLFIAITLSFTFWFLPVSFLLLIGCLVLISYVLGNADSDQNGPTSR